MSCVLLSLVIWLTAFSAHPIVLRVVVLIPVDTSAVGAASLERGITLGAEEAARTMAMFGDSLDLRIVGTSTAAATDSAVRATLAIPRIPTAIIMADGGCLTPLPPVPVPVVDAACAPTGHTARGMSAGGGPELFVRSPPGAIAAPAAPNERQELWHASLDRFGADQLNQRYARRFGRPMDSDAWAGWFAVKVLAEAALRAHATTLAALSQALTDSAARFDGHKGAPLFFDARSGVLSQPLYVVARDSTGAERVVREITAKPR